MSLCPIIVLEGGDGTGKTTLANALVKELDAAYYHATYRFGDRMDKYHTAILHQALREAEERPVILDRWYPSELVYARAFRGKSKWPYAYRMFERVGLKHNITYVFCHPRDKQVYLQAFDELKQTREEMYDSVDRVYDLFGHMIHMLRYNNGLIGFDRFKQVNATLEEQARAIGEWAWGRAERLPKFASDPNDRRFAGNPWAPVILVGDKSNIKGRHNPWPFFEYGHSSLWITKALAEMNVPESALGWINLHDKDGKVQWTLEELQFFDATFVAMGAAAQASLRSMGVHHKPMPHPQWLCRFHHEEYRYPHVQNLFSELGIVHDVFEKHRRELGVD